MENEIQKIESPLASAAALVQADGNMDVEKLSKLLEIQERWEAGQAKKAYVQAMSEFKADPPEIIKDKHVSYPTKTGGQKEYNHPTLYNVTSNINAELSKYGLTAAWGTSQEGGPIKVTCKITHVLGHSEETSLSAPPESSGGKNPIQAIGSTVTYLERYTLLALTGLATHEQDDDGNDSGNPAPQPKGPNQKEQKVLDAIYEALKPYAPEGKAIDCEKIGTVMWSLWQQYPKDENNAHEAAKFLVDKGKLPELLKDAPKPEKKGFQDKYELDKEEQPKETLPKKEVDYTKKIYTKYIKEFEALRKSKYSSCEWVSLEQFRKVIIEEYKTEPTAMTSYKIIAKGDNTRKPLNPAHVLKKKESLV